MSPDIDRIRVLTAELIESAFDVPEPMYIAELRGLIESAFDVPVPMYIAELRGLVDALDAWVTYGGLKPAAWAPPASSLV